MGLSVNMGIFLSAMAIVLIFAVVSNFLVIFIVITKKKMRNVTNIFIGNLAVSDVILGAFVLPQKLHDLSHDDNYHEGEALCRVINGFPILCITSSIFTLVAVSFERKQSIVYSLRPQITLSTCKKLVASMWVLSAIVATPSFVEYSVTTVNSRENVTAESCGSTFTLKYSILNGICVLLLAYVAPLIIMWYNYAVIIRFVMKKTSSVNDVSNIPPSQANKDGEAEKDQSNKRLATNSSLAPEASTSKIETQKTTEKRNPPVQKGFLLANRMKIIQMLIIVAVLFAISWLPYFVSLLIAKVNGSDDSEDVTGSYSLLKIFLATFSTAYNVIIYVIFNPNFRKAILDIVTCRGLKKSGNNHPSGSEAAYLRSNGKNGMHVSSVA